MPPITPAAGEPGAGLTEMSAQTLSVESIRSLFVGNVTPDVAVVLFSQAVVDQMLDAVGGNDFPRGNHDTFGVQGSSVKTASRWYGLFSIIKSKPCEVAQIHGGPRKMELTSEHIPQLRRMLNQNYTIQQIARSLGCSPPTVYSAVSREKKHIVTIRDLVDAEQVGKVRPIVTWVPIEPETGMEGTGTE